MPISDPDAGSPTAVVVIGAEGRLGRHACALLESDGRYRLAARYARGGWNESALRASGATVGLDLTVAGLGAAHGLALLRAGLRPVIGTSGVSLDETADLDAVARDLGLGGLVVPNFSAGSWLLQRAAEEAARFFPRSAIVESHHEDKRDAPSGTARDTAERMAAARGADSSEDVPIHSLRLPGVLANQEVVFGGRGEVLRLRHETYGLECYDAGLLSALRYAEDASGVGRGLGLAFERHGFL